MPQAAATAALAGQFAVEVAQEPSDTVASGLVIRSEPMGVAPPDSSVKLIVSTGPPLIIVPEVSGRSYDQAAAKLRNRRFGATRARRVRRHRARGRHDPHRSRGGLAAPRGSTVKVVISKGADLVVVPDFKGKSIEEATALAATAGVEIEPTGVVGKNHKVLAQAPDAGGKVKRATVIKIFF